MKSPKSATKENPIVSQKFCKTHKESYSMVCLHTGCHSSYKPLCFKCKKQKHYQHPNRVINLKDFQDMQLLIKYRLTANKMDFIQNSLGLCLVNIKNKLIYVNNFRIFILQKESMLMENARMIHNTVFKILEEKCHLKSLIKNINDETQTKNPEKIITSMEEIKRHISFNPIQNFIRVNSEKVGSLKVQLEKYCEATKIVINDIRQYLVKIVQVIIEEQIQQDDIQYIQHEDVDEKLFNINVKKPNHIELNQKEPRYKVQELYEMFELLLKVEVKKNQQHIENDVQKLQEEIKFKQQIVKNIRARSVSKPAQYIMSEQIKEATTPTGKNSQLSNNESNTQFEKEFSKITLHSPNAKHLKVIPKNILNCPNTSSRSPKVRSITDKLNSSPNSFGSNDKCRKQIGQNKQTSKNNIYNRVEKPEKSRKAATNKIEEQSLENKLKTQKKQNCSTKINNEPIMIFSQCEKIDQSEQQQFLNTYDSDIMIPKNPKQQLKERGQITFQKNSPQKLNLNEIKKSQQIIKEKKQLILKNQQITKRKEQIIKNNEDLNKKIQELNEKLVQEKESYNQKMKEMVDELRKSTEEMIFVVQKCRKLEEINYQLATQLRQSKQTVQKSDQITNELKLKIIILTEAIRGKQFEIDNKDQLLKQFQLSICQMQTVNKNYQDQVAELKETTKNIENQLNQKESLVKIKMQVIQHQQNEITSLMSKIADRQIQVQQLQQQLAGNQRQLQYQLILETKLQQKTASFEAKKIELQQATIKQNQLKQEVEEKNQLIRQLTLKISQKSIEAEQLKELNKKEVTKNVQVKDQFIRKLQTQNQKLVFQLGTLKANLLSFQLQKASQARQRTNFQIKNSQLQNQLQNIHLEHRNLQQEIQRLRQKQLEQKNNHQQIQKETLQKCFSFKIKFDQEKYKITSLASTQTKSAVPMIKYKELQDYCETVLRKKQGLKQQIAILKQQQAQIITDYEAKISQLNQQIVALKSIHANQWPRNTFNQQPIAPFGDKINMQNYSFLPQIYHQMSDILIQITQDMNLLQQKVKQNTVIEKVYLKELDRKRTQNRKLRQEIQEYRSRENKPTGSKTDRYSQKSTSVKPTSDSHDYKVYFVTGFAGSKSKLTGRESSLLSSVESQANKKSLIDKNHKKSALSNNGNYL